MNLFYFRVRPSDAGIYVCQGKSPAGNIDAAVRLTVLMSPELSKVPLNQTSQPGKTVEFECEANGDPKPGIVWTKQADPVSIILFVFFLLFAKHCKFLDFY